MYPGGIGVPSTVSEVIGVTTTGGKVAPEDGDAGGIATSTVPCPWTTTARMPKYRIICCKVDSVLRKDTIVAGLLVLVVATNDVHNKKVINVVPSFLEREYTDKWMPLQQPNDGGCYGDVMMSVCLLIIAFTGPLGLAKVFYITENQHTR